MFGLSIFGHRDTNIVSLSGKDMRSDILLGSNRMIFMIIPGFCVVAVKVNSNGFDIIAAIYDKYFTIVEHGGLL